LNRQPPLNFADGSKIFECHRFLRSEIPRREQMFNSCFGPVGYHSSISQVLRVMTQKIFIAGAGILFLFTARLSPAQSEPAHPILTISGSGSGANTVTNISESYYTNAFTPRQPPRNDGDGFAPPVVSGDTGWSWSSSSPTQIVSTPSGTIFPNANTAAYPVQTQAVTVFLTTATNNLTKTVNAIYYNKAGSTTSKSLVFNLIDYKKLGQLRSDFNKLAPAYVNSGSSPQTRDDNYARRIAIALLDWARWHPSYYLTAINNPSFINVTTNYLATTTGFGPQRASDHNGLAHEWQDDELLAFDAIYSSAVLTNMNAELGFDVRQYICDNLFFDEGDFLINHIPISIAIQSNLSGPYAVLPQVARVLNRYDYILWMDAYLDATVRQKIRRDGALEEGEGYSIGYLNANQDAAQNTHDFFLTRPATNSAFLAISNRALIYNNTFTYGQGQWSRISLPSGQLPAFGDTPYNNYFSSHSAGYSSLMPAYGTLSLGAGSGSQAVQLNQNFSGDNNHMRADMCAFVLWAFNNPYLDNIRYYNGSIGRNFGEQMLAYNTIEIDRLNLSPYPDADTYGNGDLTLYEPGNNGLAITEIDGQRGYSSKASRFQRLLLLNTVDLAKPYVVDVFRVAGGTTHDYLFHGAMLWNQTAQTSFPLVTNNNLYPMLESGDAAWDLSTDTPYYGFWRNVSSNAAPQNFQINYSDTNRATGRDMKLWMTGDPQQPSINYQLFLGTTPVPARDNTVPTNFFNYLNLKRPSAIIRHRVTSGPLEDLFVSVFEPLNAGVSNIVSVQRLPMSGAANESVGLKITFKDGRSDTYIVNLRNPQIAGANTGSATVSTSDGQYSLTGRVGLHVDRTNGDSRVWTMNATDFKFPGRELSTPTNTYFSGLIAGETRKLTGGAYDAFTTTTPLPSGGSPQGALQNKWLSFTHGALSGSGTTGISEMFKIDQIVFTNGLYNICFTNDHLLEINNGVTSTEQVAPLRTFTTSNSFELALSAEAQQISPIADQNIPPGNSSGSIPFNFGNLGASAGASLQVSAMSSNQVLIPNSNLVIGGSGTNRTITITPAAGQTGASLITVSVTDGTWTNSRSFLASVGNFAVITSPSSQSVLAGSTVTFTNVVIATNGSGTVGFSVSGFPAGVSANFSPPNLTDSGTNILNLTISNTTLAGTYPLTVSAFTANQFSSDTVTLIVNVVNPTPGWSTWLGSSGAGNFWSDNANWSSPLAAGNSMAFGGIARIVNTNDTAPNTIYSNIVFNASAGAFALNGNPITLAAGVTNNSSVVQTILLGLNFNNNILLNGASNALVIAGGLTNTSSSGTITLALEGTGTIANLLHSANNPGGTNILAMSSGAANWTLADNSSSTAITAGPWALQINSGTLNFGTGSDSPNLNLSQAVSGQDNEIGRAANSTGILNVNGGTLTTAVRVNTGTTTSGSTGIVNQVAGTFNIGNQFQGANVGGGNSIVAVSGGTMNINGGSGTFYVASRGIGSLTISSNGAVNCGKLDISRNAAGNSFSSAGTVNLDGGTFSVTSITNISANFQTGGNPTATFNFNGGTLVAKSGAAQIFFQGNVSTAPVTPIKTFVKLGGAIIDDGGNTITIGESLQHDASLGGNADGGLTKLNSGTLTLSATNSYTGDTTISAGTLALTGIGAITNSANISLAAGATLDVHGRNDGTLNLAAAQTLSGSGTVVGNLLLNGTISPGADSAGSLTNTGSAIFNAGGHYLFDMADAIGQPGTNWDFISISGGVSVESASTNPFVIQLRSIDGNLNDNTQGAADFGNQSSQSWIIATAAAGITNFSADKFTVDASGFANDLGGGKFSVATNENSLLLVFNPPPAPPVFSGIAFDGSSLIFSGTGGTAGGNYFVLASTNLSQPLNQWQIIATNSFDGSGNFTFTNSPTPGAPQTFYLLQLP
jgi:autotransporter-associated beta strand protein